MGHWKMAREYWKGAVVTGEWSLWGRGRYGGTTVILIHEKYSNIRYLMDSYPPNYINILRLFAKRDKSTHTQTII